MQIINIHHSHHHTHVNHNSIYSPELIHLLKQFFSSAEQRNEKLKTLIGRLQQETGHNEHCLLLEELSHHSDETELDIEIVKKLLP